MHESEVKKAVPSEECMTADEFRSMIDVFALTRDNIHRIEVTLRRREILEEALGASLGLVQALEQALARESDKKFPRLRDYLAVAGK